MEGTIGSRCWALPEGNRETASLLNTSAQDAHVEMTLFFSDREPAGPYRMTVPSRRSQPLRLKDFRDPEPVPAGANFSTVIESDVPIVVQAYATPEPAMAEGLANLSNG
jgi:hypothetical protein